MPLGPTKGEADALLQQYAQGKTAPPLWCVRAMRALEASYERRLRDAREAQVKAEELARSAAVGIISIESEGAREMAFAASSVARASRAQEEANITEYEVHNENTKLRHALAESERSRGDAEARVLHREHEIKVLRGELEETQHQLHQLKQNAENERVRAERLAGDLTMKADEAMTNKIALERAASEAARLQEEAHRLREHSHSLAHGPAARPRLHGAPVPAPMGSAAEWAALREERDSLVHLLVEMRRAAERTHPSKMLRVGGGYEQLPDYLAKLTAPLPPELRMAIAPYEVSEPEGAQAHTHRSNVRSHLSQVRRSGSPTKEAQADRVGGGFEPRLSTHRSAQQARGQLLLDGRVLSPPKDRYPNSPPRAVHFAPGRPSGILVHQKPAPPGSPGRTEPLPFGNPRHGRSPRLGEGYAHDPTSSFSLQVDYPAVGRRELFELPNSARGEGVRP